MIFEIFKILFPSWEFFDESGKQIILKYRFARNVKLLNEKNWEFISFKLKRNFYKLIYNPDANLQLAINSNLELLIDSIYNINNEKIEDNIYYKITNNYVKFYIINFIISQTELNELIIYQFKISINNYNNSDNEDDIFISEIFNLDNINE